MTHDPMCPVMTGCPCEAPDELCCACDLITQVREDERQAEANRRAARFGVWHDYDPGLP